MELRKNYSYIERTCILLLLEFLCAGGTNICTDDICRYHLVARRSTTMMYQHPWTNLIYDIKMVKGRCQIAENSYRKKTNDPVVGSFINCQDAITADGYKRSIITVNGEFPGPSIHVLEGKQVEIVVDNQLPTEALTVHWHGLSLHDAVWMDGVPYVTQCPVPPGQSFVYRLLADPPGTHWYHSHVSNQRLDGLYGAFVVHQVAPPVMPEYNVLLHDWFRSDAASLYLNNPYVKENAHLGSGEGYLVARDRLYSVDNVELSSLEYASGLINGRGTSKESENSYLSSFKFKSGEEHLLRVIHTGAEFTYDFSVDNHKVIVCATDGNAIIPIEVDSVIIFPGESIDVKILAISEPKPYWMRASLIESGRMRNSTWNGKLEHNEIRAIVNYMENRSSNPISHSKTCTKTDPCKVFSCPFGGYPESFNKVCIHLSTATSSLQDPNFHRKFGLQKPMDEVETHFFNFEFSTGSSVNAKHFISPATALFDGDVSKLASCDEESCRTSGCQCTHIHQLPYNKNIELVLSAHRPDWNFSAHHSIHIHGHHFAVVKVGFPNYNLTSGRWSSANPDVACESQLCAQPSWAHGRPKEGFNEINPPVKDTVVIPARGYVVVRFRTDNPGYWAFHCHQDMHLIEGMNMILDEAHNKHPALPPNFPSCTLMNWTHAQYMEYLKRAKYDHVGATLLVIIGGFTMLFTGIIFMVIRRRNMDFHCNQIGVFKYTQLPSSYTEDEHGDESCSPTFENCPRRVRVGKTIRNRHMTL